MVGRLTDGLGDRLRVEISRGILPFGLPPPTIAFLTLVCVVVDPRRIPRPDPNGRQKLSVAPFAASSSLGTRLCRSIHARTSGDIHPVTSRMRS